MAAVTIRELSPETHRALKCRAKERGRSTEAEIRAILDEAVRPPERLDTAAELASFRREYLDEDPVFERDAQPMEPAIFE